MKTTTQQKQTYNNAILDIFKKVKERKTYYKPEKPREVPKLTVDVLVKRSTKLLGAKFKLENHTEKLYGLICEYINKDEAFTKRFYVNPKDGEKKPFTFEKGLFLISPPGSGKSFIFEKLLPVFNFYFEHFKYNQLTAYKLEEMFSENKLMTRNVLMKKPYISNLYIDDLGREIVSFKDYGSVINLSDIFIDTRVRLKNQYGLITHGSSNFDLSGLMNRYSEPTYSRFLRLFNFVIFNPKIDFSA